MRVIVNADDFGLNACVNDRILDLMSRRRITSATLIANSPAVEEAVLILPVPLCFIIFNITLQ